MLEERARAARGWPVSRLGNERRVLAGLGHLALGLRLSFDLQIDLSTQAPEAEI